MTVSGGLFSRAEESDRLIFRYGSCCGESGFVCGYERVGKYCRGFCAVLDSADVRVYLFEYE